MSITRRGFFGLAAAAASAPLVPVPDLFVPTKTIFLPPVGGWFGGNRLLTPELWTRELLQVFEAGMAEAVELTADINRQYDEGFYRGDQWTPEQMRTATINIRRPLRFNRLASYDVRVDVGPQEIE